MTAARQLRAHFEKLMYYPSTSIRMIEVSQAEGVYWAMSGNRRLYVYQALEKYGRVKDILVEVKGLNRQRVSM